MPSAQSLADIAEHQYDIDEALRLLFSTANPQYALRFAFMTRREVEQLLRERIEEAERQSSLAALARVEAALRTDYRARAGRKGADAISVAFRTIHKKRRERARLDDDIIATWYASMLPADRVVLSKLRGMFKFRHWLAHGRYWNVASSYSFEDVYLVSNAVIDGLPLQS